MRRSLPFLLALQRVVTYAAATAVAVTLGPSAARAERAYDHAVQADLGLGVIGLAYERVLHARVAVQLEANVFGTWWGPAIDKPSFGGLGGQLRPTFFLTDDAPRGVYVAPYFRAASVTDAKNEVPGRGFGWSYGVFVGYSFMVLERLNIRIGGGAQYLHYRLDAARTTLEFKQLHPAIDLVVGYAF